MSHNLHFSILASLFEALSAFLCVSLYLYFCLFPCLSILSQPHFTVCLFVNVPQSVSNSVSVFIFISMSVCISNLCFSLSVSVSSSAYVSVSHLSLSVSVSASLKLCCPPLSRLHPAGPAGQPGDSERNRRSQRATQTRSEAHRVTLVRHPPCSGPTQLPCP